MVTEDYVSFETAKLLKEKGFDIYGDGSFGSETRVFMEYSPTGKIRDVSTSKPHPKAYPAPTLQMAMKWLREKYGIFIATEFGWFHGDWEYQASVVKMNPTVPPTQDSIEYIKAFRNKSYEIACDEAIKYCPEKVI